MLKVWKWIHLYLCIKDTYFVNFQIQILIYQIVLYIEFFVFKIGWNLTSILQTAFSLNIYEYFYQYMEVFFVLIHGYTISHWWNQYSIISVLLSLVVSLNCQLDTQPRRESQFRDYPDQTGCGYFCGELSQLSIDIGELAHHGWYHSLGR